VSTDALRAAVEADGQTRIKTILQAAREQASRIRADAESLATGIQSDVLREEELRLRREGNRRIAAARAEARKREFDARNELLDRVFAAAREALPDALERPEARMQLVARVERALSHMPEGPVVVSCSSNLASVLATALADRNDVRVESDAKLAVGFRAVGGGGSLVVDATFANLLDLDRPAFAIEILRRLEGEELGGEGG